MFRKRNVVYLFVLLALTMTLTGCFGSKEQSIDDFLKEISKAYKNLDVERAMSLTYFPNTEEGQIAKNEMKQSIEDDFSILRMLKADVEFKIEPAKDEDAIIIDGDEAVIRKGTMTQKVSFDLELLKNLIEEETDEDMQDTLEDILDEYLEGEFEQIGRIGEDDDADISPMHLIRIGGKWKINALYED